MDSRQTKGGGKQSGENPGLKRSKATEGSEDLLPWPMGAASIAATIASRSFRAHVLASSSSALPWLVTLICMFSLLSRRLPCLTTSQLVTFLAVTMKSIAVSWVLHLAPHWIQVWMNDKHLDGTINLVLHFVRRPHQRSSVELHDHHIRKLFDAVDWRVSPFAWRTSRTSLQALLQPLGCSFHLGLCFSLTTKRRTMHMNVCLSNSAVLLVETSAVCLLWSATTCKSSSQGSQTFPQMLDARKFTTVGGVSKLVL